MTLETMQTDDSFPSQKNESFPDSELPLNDTLSTVSTPFLDLPHEIISMISMHLKPRHFYKLMCTSRTIRRHIDHDHYWARVATHAVWREIGSTELQWFKEFENLYEDIPGLYQIGRAHV